MIQALAYLQFNTFKNRVWMWFRRLKQPKYLVGALAGGAYFYFYFIRFVFGKGRYNSMPAMEPSPEMWMLYESIGALILLGIVLVAWIFPKDRAALTFTEAEVAFLFPAPVTRKQLIHYKLAKSQLGILFTVLIFTLIFGRFRGGNAWFHLAGWWVVLSTVGLHGLAASFARTKLLDRGVTHWQRRLGILALVGMCIMVVVVWAKRTIPAPDIQGMSGWKDLLYYGKEALEAGPAPYVLFPFRMMVQPYFATDGLSFLKAFIPALVIMGLHYWWVVRANVAFEEASVEASAKMAEKVAAIRKGNWSGRTQIKKKQKAPFKLGMTGNPAVALLWKNLIHAGHYISFRVWLTLAIAVIGLCVFLNVSKVAEEYTSIIGMFSVMAAFWAVLFGPQVVRQDFRHDVAVMDILKMYPVKGWQIALGELLAPTLMLTGVQWLMLIMATGLFTQVPGTEGFGLLHRLPFALAAAVVVPALNMVSLIIPNAAVLLFPAWFQTAKGNPGGGIEVMGQRLIFFLGQALVLAITLIPAGIAFAVMFMVGKLFAGMGLAVLMAAVAAAFVLALEAAGGVYLLGRLFARFDVSLEQGN